MANSTYDLIVVGCGAAGLSAALAFVTEGESKGFPRSVAILESAPADERGGATRWTMATFRVGDDDRLDPFWVGIVQDVSKGLSDIEFCRVFEREVPTTLGILRALGVELTAFERHLATGMGEKLMAPNGGGRAIIDAIAARLEQNSNVTFFYDTEAVKLAIDASGRVCGLAARTADGLLQNFASQSVVLACGGFEGNKAMLTQYIGRNACDLPLIAPGVAYNKGAGIRMATDIGADTAGQFDMMHAELVDRRTTRADAVIYGHTYGIVVNDNANRFFDEGQSALDASFELIAYEVWKNQRQSAYFIADQTIAKIPTVLASFDTDLPPVEANSVEDLADQLGLDPEKLARTISDYNAAVGPGEFDPSKLDGKATTELAPPKSNWAYPLINPPYFAYPLTAAITFTYGGLKTDTDGRVIATNGRPLPGLYAAGEIAGLFYHEYPAATSVLKALTFGRRAGAHAAQNSVLAGA